jgi:anti-anti-sigma factor
MIMTSAGATARQAGRRPGAGPAAARTIVRLGGALDFAAAPALRERLIGMLHPGTRLLVLDLSRVRSCDSAGLAVLIGIQRRARQIGIVLRLAAPSPPVAELLRRTGLDRSLTTCPDLRGALAAERHEPAKAAPALRPQPCGSWPARQGPAAPRLGRDVHLAGLVTVPLIRSVDVSVNLTDQGQKHSDL